MEPTDEHVQVHFLETSDDRAILDPDDVLCDVVDDKDKLLAVFQEGSSQLLHRPALNGGYGTSPSSVGTASPDLSQHEDEPPKYIEEQPLKQFTSIKPNTNGEIKTAPRAVKSPPPPVPPKPVRNNTKNSSRTSYIESVPSEDSGISSHDDRFRISSDSSKSETIENVVVKPTIYKTGEMTFVAVGMPVKQAVYNGQNGHANHDRRRFSSTSSDHADNEHSDMEEETFSLGRNSARRSMFVDSPMLDRWAELQEERMFVNNPNRSEPVSTVTSPSEPSSIEPDFALKYDDDQQSQTSQSSGEPDMLMIELSREDPTEPLGFTVTGYRTADSRELGLIVRDISPSGCAARDGRLEIADRIVEVNGWSLMDMPNERAEELFAEAIKASVVNLGVSRTHSFVPGQKSDTPHDDEVIHAQPIEENNESQQQQQQDQTPREILPLTPRSMINSPSIPDNSFKKVNKRILIELMKGIDGLGFSITTRDNPAGGNTPIFVKSILPKGAAIEDGQLRAGDQIVEVNGQKMFGKSQAEAVNVLRSTKGLVKILVQREETVQSPRAPAIEVNEDSMSHLKEEGLQVLTFKIALDVSGAAGLGVSVKGKSRGTAEEGRDSPQDKGIFVKSIIPGGAAAKDGRLCPNDQLLRVNGKSLVGLTNQSAMDTLRIAMQSTRPNQAFIDVTIAREQEEAPPPPGELLHSRSLERLNAPDQERPIEASSEERLIEGPQSGNSETDGGSLKKERLPSRQEDQFNESMVSRNLSPIRARNAVHRNDSYCVAINKSQIPGSPFYSPFRQRPVHRPSPLAMINDRAPPLAPSSPTRTSTPMDSRSEYGIESGANVPTGRPTSTVAIPTPPLESTDEKPTGPASPSQVAAKPLAPQPPPRWDSEADPSANNNYNLQARLKLKLKMPDAEGPQKEGTNIKLPSPPSQFSNQSPSQECPPSYDQAVARLGRSPHASVSSEPSTPSREQRKSFTEENVENSIIAPPSPFSEEENPFQRDGFGRTSMSEKRGRATLDARQSEYFIKREQERTEDYTSQSEDGEIDEEKPELAVTRQPLRRADSDDEQLRHQLEEESKEEIRPSPYGRMTKSRSTGQLKHIGLSKAKEKKAKSNDNLSFTSAVESANRSYPGDFQNGHARFSPSDEQEVPITMRSNADFTAVQQKLATKKPFYKGISSVFKIGKNKRGDYSLSDGDGPAFKHTYSKEALIDFPSEQRYRQLVNHYGQERPSERANTLPTRGRKKREAKEKEAEERRPPPPPVMKVGRVTVTAPTRV